MPQSGKNWVIEPLGNNHNRTSFECGFDSLDNYIKKQAKQDIKRHISQVFVVTEINQSNTICGFYTLSTLSIELESLPQSLSKKLPRHPIPAALIGRLAVKQSMQGSGIGKLLLADAIKRILSVRNEIAIYAVVVDAIDKSAMKFYKQFGFIQLCAQPSRLFLPLHSVVVAHT